MVEALITPRTILAAAALFALIVVITVTVLLVHRARQRRAARTAAVYEDPPGTAEVTLSLDGAERQPENTPLQTCAVPFAVLVEIGYAESQEWIEW